MRKGLEKIGRFICNKYCLITVFILWALSMLAWTYLYKTDVWASDAGLYQYYAQDCLSRGHLYPDMEYYTSEYIFGNGWVCFLELWLLIFGSFSNVPYFLCLLNVINLSLTITIASKLLSNKKFVYLVAYAYMLLPGFATNAIILNTDVPFLTLVLLSFYLLLDAKVLKVVLAGICVALSLWMRPISEAWIVGGLYLLIFAYRKYEESAIYTVSVLAVCLLIGWATHLHFPDYVYKSSTMGVNLVMSVGNTATGGYNWQAFQEGNIGYIEGLYSETSGEYPVYSTVDWSYFKRTTGNLTYKECDKEYIRSSLSWIRENPLQWLKINCKKIKILFFEGTWAPEPFYFQKYKFHAFFRIMYLWQRIAVSIIMIIGALGLFTTFWKEKMHIYLLCPIVLALGITMFVTVDPRYNFIVLPFIIIWDVILIEELYVGKLEYWTPMVMNKHVREKVVCKN